MRTKARIRSEQLSRKSRAQHRPASKNRRPESTGQPRSVSSRAALSGSALLQLQQIVGNRAASRLVSAAGKNTVLRQAAGAEPMLRYGAKSEAVKMLQHYLVEAGADIAVDGIFGPITHQAVIAYQKSNGLAVDGIVGPQTWASLKTGGGTIDAEKTGRGAFGQSDLADQIAAKMKAVAVTFRSLSSSAPRPKTETQFSLSELIEGVTAAEAKTEVIHSAQNPVAGQTMAQVTVMRQSDEEVQESPETAAAEGSQPPVAELMSAAFEVNQAIAGLSVEAQTALGPAVETLQTLSESVGVDPAAAINHTTLSDLDSILSDAQVIAANQAGGATATGSTEFKITKDDTYKFKLDTIAGAGQELDNHMSVHGEAAHVVLKPQETKFEIDAQTKKVVKATVLFHLERELPEWTNVEDVGKKCPCWKKEWDRFDEAIKLHEQQHINIYKKLLAGLHAKCIGKSEQEAGDAIDKAIEAAEKLQEEFDTKTNHGQTATPSTKFNAGISCAGCK